MKIIGRSRQTNRRAGLPTGRQGPPQIYPGEITSNFTLMEYALLPWGGQGRHG